MAYLTRIRHELSNHELYPTNGILIENNLALAEAGKKLVLMAYIIGPE